MNTPKKILCNALLAALFLVSFLAPQHILAQETAASSPVQFSNHASWGVNYAGGDASYGRGVLMLSTSYGRQILPWLELEAAAQGFAFSEGFSSSIPQIPSAINVQGSNGPAYSWNSNTAFFDISAMMQPFQGVGLRFGIGPTVRIWESARLSVGWGSRQFQGQPMETFVSIQNERFRAWQFGANAKIEYLIPISQQCDVAIRGQVHIVAQPFTVTDVVSPYPIPYTLNWRPFGGGASLGAFFRIGF